jgi:para-nitrobenzyl esterase
MRHPVCVLLLLAACGGSGDELTITIDSGTLHGVLQGETRAFLGVPYAAPPVGPLRWKPPQPAIPFDGTREAIAVGSQCPQSFSLAGPGGEEDCLFLNVWTPRGADGAPVMVWLHGGAFVFGSGGDPYYSGRYLAESYGAIIVTVNYRLGPLGFLAHPALTAEDPAYPSSGNYGIDDQLAALQWVQRNIAAFGGDTTRVALWGESAGGFSACVHYVSPRSADLFAWAISESGLCASPVTEPTHADAEAIGIALAEQLGCTGAGALACLRAKSADDLLNATALPPPAQQLPGGPFYAATIPIPTPNIDGFVVPKSLRQAFAEGGFPARPLLLGTNHDEGTLFHSVLFAKEVTTETEVRDALTRRFGAAKVDAIVAQYPIASYPSAQAALAQITGDAFFVCPARWTARGALAAGAPVFRYTFDELPESAALSGLGTFHSAEIPYVFGNDNFPLATVGASGLPLSAAMQGYWTRFAATGSPAGGDVEWPGAANDQVLELHDPVTATSTLPAAPCDFWDAL